MPDDGTHPGGGEINNWKYYSGRFEQMDLRYLAEGYAVDWALGEGGPVRDDAPWRGHLQPNDGWKHPECCNAALHCYLGMIQYWLENAAQTRAFKENRLIGMTLFTTGGGGKWEHFETSQPELNYIAILVRDFINDLPDKPPPPPPPEPERGQPRIQYHRQTYVAPQDATLAQWLAMAEQAYKDRRSAGFSYDDAGVGDLDNRTAVL